MDRNGYVTTEYDVQTPTELLSSCSDLHQAKDFGIHMSHGVLHHDRDRAMVRSDHL
jgi:hypothetical protein